MRDTPKINREEIVQELFDNMATLKRSLYAHAHQALGDAPIPRAQLEVLFTIHHMRSVSSKEVAHTLQLTPGAVSQLVEALEFTGYVSRKTDTTDRRVQLLALTAQGDEIIHAVQKQRHTLMSTLMEELSDDELTTWLKVQRKMIQQFITK